MYDVDPIAIVAVDDSARQFDDLSIPQVLEPDEHRTAGPVFGELAYVVDHTSNELPRCSLITQGDVVGDRVELGQRRLGPDYVSHRDRR